MRRTAEQCQDERRELLSTRSERGRSKTIIATGIDWAKKIFAVRGVNQGGSVVQRQPKLAHAKLRAMIAALPPCVIEMEAEPGRGAS